MSPRSIEQSVCVSMKHNAASEQDLGGRRNRLATQLAELRTLKGRSLMGKIKNQIETPIDASESSSRRTKRSGRKQKSSLQSAGGRWRDGWRSDMRKCPSLANSMVVKPLLWPAWRNLTTTVDHPRQARHLRWRPRSCRLTLHGCTFPAARFNPILSRFYQRLRAKAKPHKLASHSSHAETLLALNHSLQPEPILA